MKTNFSATYSRRNAGSAVTVLATAIAAFVLSANALAQQSPRIILQNSENTEIELLAGSDLTVNPISGNVTATPADPAACTGIVGPTCDDVDVEVLSLTRSQAAVPQGTNVQMTWSSRGAWSCTGSGLPGTTWNSGGKLPGDSQTIATGPLDPDTYTVVITCENGPVTDQASVQLEILDPNPDVPQFCIDQGRVPPLGMTQDTTILWGSGQFAAPLPTETVSWLGTFGANFPNGNNRNMEIVRDRYAQLVFNSGNLANGASGRLLFNTPQFSFGVLTSGQWLITMSECPGDFGPQPDPNCRDDGFNGRFSWQRNAGSSSACNLQPNKTYYLNMLYTDDPDGSPLNWECTGATSRCGNTLDIVVN